MKAFFITFGLLCATAVQGNPWAKNCNNDGDCDEGFVCGGTNSMITTAWSGKCVRDGDGDGVEVMKKRSGGCTKDADCDEGYICGGHDIHCVLAGPMPKRGSRGGEACLSNDDCAEGMECGQSYTNKGVCIVADYGSGVEVAKRTPEVVPGAQKRGSRGGEACLKDEDCAEGMECGQSYANKGVCIVADYGSGVEEMKKRGSRGGEACLKDEDCAEGMECGQSYANKGVCIVADYGSGVEDMKKRGGAAKCENNSDCASGMICNLAGIHRGTCTEEPESGDGVILAA